MYVLHLAYVILEKKKLNADGLNLCLDSGTALKVKKGTREDMRKDNLPTARLPPFLCFWFNESRDFLERDIWKLWVKSMDDLVVE